MALLLTAFVGLFISYKLFRWEKEEKIRASAKLWLAAVLTPFLLLGLLADARSHRHCENESF
jgi:hypothetical protein